MNPYNSNCKTNIVNEIKPERRPIIACHMDDLSVRISDIEQTISTLHTRLGPVIQPDRPLPSDPKKAVDRDVETVLMASQLMGFKDRLSGIRDFLADIIDRLEV